MNPIYQNLKTYFGYDSFRPGQEKIITAILSGRDALGIMPTGAGKSLCYQIPALTFPGLTLVISPLISLMEDQVATLKRRGIGAEFINSAVDINRKQRILSSISAQYSCNPPAYIRRTPSSSSSAFHRCYKSTPIKLLYVSPERLSAPEFRAFAQKIRISLLCVDEAHCISLWGRQFRPEYMKIAEFVEALPDRPVIAAFTATANAEVRSDIIDNLKLREPYVLTTGFDRPNLYFEVQKVKDKWPALSSLLIRHRGECGIIYCLTRRTVESLSRKLEVNGFTVTHYHGGMPLEEREKAQRDWLGGKRNVIVATNAFGMGIDKPDVRFVIHYNMPGSMENYYQEAGRAGRDGLPSDCIILYNYRDVVINRLTSTNFAPTRGESSRRCNASWRVTCVSGSTCSVISVSTRHPIAENVPAVSLSSPSVSTKPLSFPMSNRRTSTVNSARCVSACPENMTFSPTRFFLTKSCMYSRGHARARCPQCS